LEAVPALTEPLAATPGSATTGVYEVAALAKGQHWLIGSNGRSTAARSFATLISSDSLRSLGKRGKKDSGKEEKPKQMTSREMKEGQKTSVNS